MKIIIDGDACPVVDNVIKIAKEFSIDVIMICDTSHYTERNDCTVIIVPKGYDSTDFAILQRAAAGDIVVTQDYGLAAMCLGMGIKAINQNGIIYTNSNIDELLLRRHISRIIRKTGGKPSKIPPRRPEQTISFGRSLIRLINDSIIKNKGSDK